MMRKIVAVIWVAGLFGCPNQESADPPPPPPPAGASLFLESANLAPAAQAAEDGTYRVRIRLRASEGTKSKSEDYEIRGGFVPTTR